MRAFPTVSMMLLLAAASASAQTVVAPPTAMDPEKLALAQKLNEELAIEFKLRVQVIQQQQKIDELQAELNKLKPPKK